MRADQLLVERGVAASRAQAQRLIASGLRWRVAGGAWQRVTKNGAELPVEAELELLDDAEARYVSRGGLKLQGALDAAGLDVRGWRCLDVGQSTGGFTDCLLQRGAERVVGVDVGHGQLHPRLRADPRVCALEGVNARSLNLSKTIAEHEHFTPAFGGKSPEFDLIVGDLSFISLTRVLPALTPMLGPSGQLLMLVKPQFELQPADIGKGGLVKDAARYPEVEQRLRAACRTLGLEVLGWFDSPITGGDGNREFFIHARWSENAAPTHERVPA